MQEMRSANVRPLIHGNYAVARSGPGVSELSAETARSSEFITMLGKEFRDGDTVQSFGARLYNERKHFKCEAVMGSGQSDYMDSGEWLPEEAEAAARLWMGWIGAL